MYQVRATAHLHAALSRSTYTLFTQPPGVEHWMLPTVCICSHATSALTTVLNGNRERRPSFNGERDARTYLSSVLDRKSVV